MQEIRKQRPEDLDAVVALTANAFPKNRDLSPEGMEREKIRLRDLMADEPEIEFYGLYEGDVLVAVARYYRLHTNLFGKVVPAAGIGSLGVDLAHKKKKSAHRLMAHFEAWAEKNDLPAGFLLPFRPDFYKRLGYGFGTTFSEYRIAPKYIPSYEDRKDVRLIAPFDRQAILDYHQSRLAHTHGLIGKLRREKRRIMTDKNWRYVASYDKKGAMEGYFRFYFRDAENTVFSAQHLVVDEWHVDSPPVLRKLLDFVRKQDDQVELVLFQTPWDDFHFLFDNPLDHSGHGIPWGNRRINTQYSGMMYKIFSSEKAFAKMDWRRYPDAELTVGFEVIGEPLGDVPETFTVGFYENRALLSSEKPDAVIRIKRSDFSSLFMGTVRFQHLVNYCLASIDDPAHIETVDHIFRIAHKPACNTDF